MHDHTPRVYRDSLAWLLLLLMNCCLTNNLLHMEPLPHSVASMFLHDSSRWVMLLNRQLSNQTSNRTIIFSIPNWHRGCQRQHSVETNYPICSKRVTNPLQALNHARTHYRSWLTCMTILREYLVTNMVVVLLSLSSMNFSSTPTSNCLALMSLEAMLPEAAHCHSPTQAV